ncbi:unnamed protein product [Arabidopsis lyrata]|nr:unnamed protein product [Arabidopsis lyrata]
MKSNHTWHIISPVRKLNGSCQRIKRSSKTGRWKVNGKCTIIKDVVTGKEIGSKKYLDFMLKEKKNPSSSSSASSPRGMQRIKSGWSIHEYSSFIEDEPKKDAFVLCKLRKKATAVGEASQAVAAAVTDPAITPNHAVDASSAAAAVTHPPMVTPNEMLNNNNSMDDWINELLASPDLGYYFQFQDVNIDGN